MFIIVSYVFRVTRLRDYSKFQTFINKDTIFFTGRLNQTQMQVRIYGRRKKKHRSALWPCQYFWAKNSCFSHLNTAGCLALNHLKLNLHTIYCYDSIPSYLLSNKLPEAARHVQWLFIKTYQTAVKNTIVLIICCCFSFE